MVLNGPVLDSVATPTGNGYSMVGSDGGVFAFGGVTFHGSLAASPPAFPIVAIAARGSRYR